MRAIYVRVSTKGQDTRSQEGELRAWAAAQSEAVEWYRDKATGTSFARPGWHVSGRTCSPEKDAREKEYSANLSQFSHRAAHRRST